MRQSFLPFALPDLDESETKIMADTVASGWITTGPKTKQFEAEFAREVGAKHAIAVNSCTAAMHLALEAIGLQSGDEVITTPYTFAATAEVIRYFDAKPVFVDVNIDDLNIDIAQIEGKITPRTRAIVPVHIAGLPSNLDDIGQIAKKHNLSVIEDAAHAFPCYYRGRKVGQAAVLPNSIKPQTTGHSICFSFYATKTITTGEGGMICTDDDAIAERCRIMALHGISKDAWKRYTAEGSWYYEIVAPGYKYNMTDIAASMGIAQLAKADRMWRRRCEIAMRYNEAFSSIGALQTPSDRTDSQHAWHLYMLRINHAQLSGLIDGNVSTHETDNELKIRARFIDELKRRNIGTSVHFIPLHLHSYYRDTYGYRPEDFPVSFREYRREISLPIYSKMNDDDVRDVIEAVTDVVKCSDN